MRKLLITLALLVSTSIPAIAGHGDPSFNCNYAKLPAEMAICASENLSELDVENAKFFYGVRNHVSSASAKRLSAVQRRWLQERNACGYDDSCIVDEYKKNKDFLCNLVEDSGLDRKDDTIGYTDACTCQADSCDDGSTRNQNEYWK